MDLLNALGNPIPPLQASLLEAFIGFEPPSFAKNVSTFGVFKSQNTFPVSDDNVNNNKDELESSQSKRFAY